MIRRALARTSLRIRLVAAIVLLVAVALTAITAVGAIILRGALLDRIDDQLETLARGNFSPPADAAPADPGDGNAPVGGTLFLNDVQVHSRDANGKPVTDDPQRRPVGPAVPEDPAWLDEHTGRPLTVDAATGDGTWRVLVQQRENTSGWVVVAANLDQLNGTISRLVGVDLIVGGIGLLILAAVGVALVRTSLRPLIRMEETAAAIAAGDLSQRVPDRPPQTELGRLGGALNGMLTQIESAFDARARSEAGAQRSEDRMRRFISDAGHELRTPLTVIRASAESIQRGPERDRAELERAVRTMGEEATRMGALVDDLLLLARLDQHRPLERQPVDLLALAIDAVRNARILAPERTIDLTVEAGVAYLVLGDENRLRQVLANLTGNALTHTPAGTPVSLVLRPGQLRENPAAVAEVTDQGPGLTPEQAERVFERFYRADTSRTRDTGGSGLGLAIVASLATAHGGTVSVHSSPGARTTFRLTLPLADADAPAHEPDDPNEPDRATNA